MLKKIFIVLLVALIIIQFIHPKKNKAEGEQINYIGNAFNVTNEVKVILAKACNDCHTNNTNNPWYINIQPVDWWMNHHVNDGKKELNFDEYINKNLRFQYHKMEEIDEMIKEGDQTQRSTTPRSAGATSSGVLGTAAAVLAAANAVCASSGAAANGPSAASTASTASTASSSIAGRRLMASSSRC